ncbi:hypothetical protein S83_029428, partial [Arachis hypogaea]
MFTAFSAALVASTPFIVVITELSPPSLLVAFAPLVSFSFLCSGDAGYHLFMLARTNNRGDVYCPCFAKPNGKSSPRVSYCEYTPIISSRFESMYSEIASGSPNFAACGIVSKRKQAETNADYTLQVGDYSCFLCITLTTVNSIRKFIPDYSQSIDARENGMGISLFCRLSETHPEAITKLQSQYRMRQGIIDLSNALIYGDRLRCGSSEITNATLEFSNLNCGLTWLEDAKLSTGGDDAWKEREAAVLALGAIGEGCINGLYPHLVENQVNHFGVYVRYFFNLPAPTDQIPTNM